MGIFSNNLLAGAGGQAGGTVADFYDFQIEQSVRFSVNESTHMSRTPSSTGNRRTFTFSTWLKRVQEDDDAAFFGTYTGSSAESAFKFSGGSTHLDKLSVYNYTGSVENPSQNLDTFFNLSGQTNFVGWYGNSDHNRFHGYMAETILVDG